MDEAPSPGPLPPGLRWLQALVIVLTLTMILAVITIVVVLVTRAPQVFSAAQVPVLPEQLVLPAGSKALAVTQGPTWTLVVTSDERVLVFDRKGKLRQEVTLVQGLAD
jgi:cell division septal protein FtsQ